MSNTPIKKEVGQIVVLSAPSGAGKTTLARKLERSVTHVHFSTSHTTRPPRPGEVNGKDYFFVDLERFIHLMQAGEFVEYATVHGNYYGTSARHLREAVAEGKTILLDIDCQGAFQIKEKFPESILIFILPPSIKELRERIMKRGKDDEDTIKIRLENALGEIAQYHRFDYVIVNENFDVAYRELESILIARKLQEQVKVPLAELMHI
ncbi:guanylate kinase [Chrysiogenes arsenatis]|uniref:guanylate kinase n=1 Tax=Chrysiogenes arsenatis TaxID=309797 RepID=UPI000421F516|nr:guanylate kinase [Chrysiogenes arsenatis]